MTGGTLVEYIVLGLVLAACIAYVVVKARRKLSGSAGCGCSMGCGCSAADNSLCAPFKERDEKSA